jgi:hypothetical protein
MGFWGVGATYMQLALAEGGWRVSLYFGAITAGRFGVGFVAALVLLWATVRWLDDLT